MKAIAVIGNLSKPQVGEVAHRICTWCRANRIQAFVQEELNCGDELFKSTEPLPQVDLVMILGGDGTFLSAARRYSGTTIPFLGVNLGHLGFLAEVEVADLETALEKLVNHEFYVEKRAVLSARAFRQGRELENTFALNEVTIAKGPLSRIIQLDVFVDNVLLGSYYGDGMIVSTPTGSTGYSLSAGGPIVAPDVDLVIITPICPHTLHARPVVVSRKAKVIVEVKTAQQDIYMTVDGQHSFGLQHGDTVEITNGEAETALVRLRGNNFFNILRQKLMEQNRKG